MTHEPAAFSPARPLPLVWDDAAARQRRVARRWGGEQGSVGASLDNRAATGAADPGGPL